MIDTLYPSAGVLCRIVFDHQCGTDKRAGDRFEVQGRLIERRGFGFIGNASVGIVGAFIAGASFPALGFSVGGGFMASILHATVGSVVFLVFIGLIRRN